MKLSPQDYQHGGVGRALCLLSAAAGDASATTSEKVLRDQGQSRSLKGPLYQNLNVQIIHTYVVNVRNHLVTFFILVEISSDLDSIENCNVCLECNNSAKINNHITPKICCQMQKKVVLEQRFIQSPSLSAQVSVAYVVK